jgi:hypothetical protein
MKMSHKLFERLKEMLDGQFTDRIIQAYETGGFHNADKVKDLNMRFRWDAFWRACAAANAAQSQSFRRQAYEVEKLNDEHIDTALRRIAPVIQRRY